jgi:RimJ/RimL family protein N-acetyltransferase
MTPFPTPGGGARNLPAYLQSIFRHSSSNIQLEGSRLGSDEMDTHQEAGMTQQPTPYRIETGRTVLRCWELTDAALLRKALDRSDQHLRPWIAWMKNQPQSLGETAEWIRQTRARFDLDQDHRFAIFDARERELLGETALFNRAGEGAREIGYWIDLQSTGQGYATEAAAAMVRVGFEVCALERLEIRVARGNESSSAIPSKLGFRLDGILRRRIRDSEGALHDGMAWTLFADEYRGSTAASVPARAFDCTGQLLLDSQPPSTSSRSFTDTASLPMG